MYTGGPSRRDYRPQPAPSRQSPGLLRGFLAGLGIGLVVAVVVWVNSHRPVANDAAPRGTAAPAEASPAAEAPAAPGRRPESRTIEGGVTGESLTFYERLPRSEVVLVPQERHDVTPAAKPFDRPGAYVLQAGAFNAAADAEALRARLARMGISSTIQQIRLEGRAYHRVRVGPVRDLARVNSWYRQMDRAGIEPIVIHVGD
ncbi:MAG: hypothetical protein RL026_782 [Pseudomonadota bacterium]|jgi:cell division protein FtsN